MTRRNNNGRDAEVTCVTSEGEVKFKFAIHDPELAALWEKATTEIEEMSQNQSTVDAESAISHAETESADEKNSCPEPEIDLAQENRLLAEENRQLRDANAALRQQTMQLVMLIAMLSAQIETPGEELVSFALEADSMQMPLDRPISTLDLTPRQIDILHEAQADGDILNEQGIYFLKAGGVQKVRDLVEFSRLELYLFSGFGYRDVMRVTKALKAIGLGLKEEEGIDANRFKGENEAELELRRSQREAVLDQSLMEFTRIIRYKSRASRMSMIRIAQKSGRELETETVRDLLWFSHEDLLQVEGVGPWLVKELEKRLSFYGLELASK